MPVPSDLVPCPESLTFGRLLHKFDSLHGQVVSCFLNHRYVISSTQNLFQISERVWQGERGSSSGETENQRAPAGKTFPEHYVAHVTRGVYMEGSMRTDCPVSTSAAPGATAGHRSTWLLLKLIHKKLWPLSPWHSKLLRANFREEAHPCSL